MKKIKIEQIILLFISFYLVVDTINGLTLRIGDYSVSKPYKIAVLLFLFMFLIKHKIYAPLKIISILFIIVLIHLFRYQTDEFLIEISWLLKFFMTLNTYYFFKWYIEYNKNAFNNIKKIFFFFFIVLFFNLIIGYLGYGYAQYGNTNAGTRGYFFAGNEVNLVLLVLAMFNISHQFIINNIKKYLIYSAVFIFGAVLLSSRTTIAGILLIIFITPILKIFSGGKKSFRIGLFSILLMIAILSYSFPFVYNFLMNDMNAKEQYQKIEKSSESLMAYGGRGDWANSIFDYSKENIEITSMLFGFSYSKEVDIIGKMTEIDIVDVLFVYGAIGFIVLYGFYFNILIKSYKFTYNQNINNPFSLFIFFFTVLLIAISITAGHVIFTGMPSIVIGILFSLIHLPQNKIAKNE